MSCTTFFFEPADAPAQSYSNGYEDIRRVLEQFGFSRQQGSVYFGGRGVDPVRCVVAAQALQKKHPWFAKCVRDIRMLRIEENNNLMPALGQQDLGLDTPVKVQK